MSFAQRATFGRGRAGSGYALAAPRDNFGWKILGRNFSKIGENFIFVFLQSQVASDSKTNLLFEKLDPNYGGGVCQGFSSRGLKRH